MSGGALIAVPEKGPHGLVGWFSLEKGIPVDEKVALKIIGELGGEGRLEDALKPGMQEGLIPDYEDVRIIDLGLIGCGRFSQSQGA